MEPQTMIEPVAEEILIPPPKMKVLSISRKRYVMPCFGPGPDPNWVYTDAAGAEHRWQRDEEQRWWLPTLRREEHSGEFELEMEDSDSYSTYHDPIDGALVQPGIMMHRFLTYTPERFEGTIEARDLPPVEFQLEDTEVLGSGQSSGRCLIKQVTVDRNADGEDRFIGTFLILKPCTIDGVIYADDERMDHDHVEMAASS